MDDPDIVDELTDLLLAGASPSDLGPALSQLVAARSTHPWEQLVYPDPPTLLPVPDRIRGFELRLDLVGAKPPVWRRLEVPGDITLPRLHDVIQAAMGWEDYHLYRFRTGSDYRSPYFVTHLDDEDEAGTGLREDDVRLDQILTDVGDALWYEYDFGDGWEHRLVVEQVSDRAPDAVRCTAGRSACPPEDCGGLGGYAELAAWARAGHDEALLPSGFEDAAHAHAWLPDDWHPDHFDLDAINAEIAVATAVPADITAELAAFAHRLGGREVGTLREVLGRPATRGRTDVSDEEAGRLTDTYRLFLDILGDGVRLTSAGYLPPKTVAEIAAQTGITAWWIGKANREDLTPPVADIRDTARTLGLVTVRNGQLRPTAAARRCHGDAQALWRHIVSRLPVSRKDAAHHDAGWLILAFVAGGVAAEEWQGLVSAMLYELGWRSGYDRVSVPPANSPTLTILEILAGGMRTRRGRISGVDDALAATARAVIRRA